MILTAYHVLTLVAAVENEDHCDFRKLRSLLIRTHMLDLISTTEEVHYENYRQAQMEVRKFGSRNRASLRTRSSRRRKRR